MTPLFAIFLALIVWETLARRGPFGGLRLPRPAFGPLAIVAAASALIAAFAGQIALSEYQAVHDGIRPAWFMAAPLHLVDDAYKFGRHHPLYSFGALGFVLIQMGALFVVASGCANLSGRLARVVPWVAGGALAALAICSPVITSGDVFGYVGLGMLGTHPFERPIGFFQGQFAQVFDGYPIRPTVYGPAWVALNALVVGLGSTFLAKIVALRLLGAVLLGVLVALVRAAGAGRAAQYAVALNPMLWLQFVVNAHNDLLAVVLVIAALVAVQRRVLWVAVVLVAAAGAVKLPLVVLGIVVFARHPERRAAVFAAAASIALAVGISAGIGGHQYFDALVATGRGRVHWPPEGTVARAIMAAIVLAATAYALFLRRFNGFAAWFYPGLAPLIFPWYFVWTMPYVCVVGTGLFETMIAMPLVAALADTIYGLDYVGVAIAIPVGLFAVGGLLRRRLAPQPA